MSVTYPLRYVQRRNSAVGEPRSRALWREEPVADRLPAVRVVMTFLVVETTRSAVTKGIRIRNGCTRVGVPVPDNGVYLALTFGTLLSSQGASAHRSRSFDLSRGNPINLATEPARCQS